MKVSIICLAFATYVMAEPPVDNRYLPPQQRYQSGLSTPSQTYGVPSSGFGNQRQTNAVFRGRPSSTYGVPSRSRRPSNQYGPPTRNLPNLPSRPNLPTNAYLPPNQAGNMYQRSNQLSNQIQGSNQYQAPSAQYGVPSEYDQASLGGQFTGIPSQEYGAPEISANKISQGDFSASNSFAQRSRQYLPPGRSGYDDGSNGEPANYNFEYMVRDDASGNDFGHRESRQGDRAEGLYYVLLPDGRKQTVEYEADQDGYKPRISYEDIGAGAGYSRNAGYENQYPSGPY